jgi:hyaluronoglucosaminidase
MASSEARPAQTGASGTAGAAIGVPEMASDEFIPDGLAITPDGATVYVINGGTNCSGDVLPIRTADNAVGPVISAGSRLVAIVVTPDGKTAYVTSYRDGTVIPISTATNTPGTPIPVGTGPGPIVISP